MDDNLHYQFLGEVFAALPAAAYYKSTNGEINNCNEAFRRLFGIVDTECSIGDALPQELLQIDQEVDLVVLATLEHTRRELQFRDGARSYDLVVEKIPFREAGGTVLGTIGVITDLTEHKSIQRMLNHELSLRLAVFDCLDSAVLLIDPDTLSIRITNAATQEVFGFEPSELIGTPAAALYPDAAAAANTRAAIDAALARSGVFRGELVLRRRDGSTFDAELTCRRTAPTSGWKSSYVEAIRDITDRKTAQRLSARRQEELDTILEHVPAVVMRLSPELRITFVNSRIRQFVAIEPARIVGTYLDRLAEVLPIDDESVRSFAQAIRNALATGEAQSAEGQIRIEQRRIWTQTHIVPEVDSENRLIGALALVQDVTSQRAAELELRENQAKMQEMQRMEAIGQLAGGVAHDFNNILTAIHGYAHLVARAFAEDSAEFNYVQQIQSAITRATRLTSQMLLFSRNAPSDFRPMDINGVVDGMAKMLRRLISERVTIQWLLGERLSAVNGDVTKIEQIIMNLVINARDAMPEGGTVEIQTIELAAEVLSVPASVERRADRYVVLIVRDSGVGMSDQTMQRIFDPFFSTKEPGRGTGLGLAVVYGIVREHNGWIEVRSKPRAGTAFNVYFPALDEPAQSSPSVAPATLRARTPVRSATLLLVEDEPGVRSATKIALDANGYRVHDVSTVGGARELMQGTSFDVVISDLVLSDGRGTELARTVDARRGTRFIFVSGYVPRGNSYAFIRKRGYPFLSKPYTIAGLMDVLDRILQ